MSDIEYVSIDKAELKRLQADSAELARLREPVEGIEVAGWSVIAKYPHMPARSALFFTEGEADSQGFKWCFDDGVVSITPLVPMPKVKRAIAQAGKSPEGFVLVPVEPTTEIITAIIREADRQERLWSYSGEAFYRAMLAAAPKGDSHE